MRLIDADKLILHLNDYAYQETPIECDKTSEVYMVIGECIKAVEEAPTVEYICEFCGHDVLGTDKYCSYCGAKMEYKEDD